MQKKIVRSLSNGNEFVAYVDAIGHVDGNRRLPEWKTTSARYPEQPEGLTSLDLQLVCYSWITGISDVAIVAFVRKRVPEIQYLLASITDEQRREFGQIVGATVGQIETAQFPPRPGIRFPQNGCVSCAHLGLCLGNQPLIDIKLIRQAGASDLDWLNVLDE
jgi:PD-(D/E)XK nuclease superfamily